MAPVFAYWNIRGLAQPIRHLLHYAGEEYEEKLYECGPAPDFNRDCWLNEKFTLGLDFPNLPYYSDGDIKITQSNAILRYIARKHNLCGTTEAEKARVDMMADQAMDFRNGIVRLAYGPNLDTQKPKYMEKLPTTLKTFEDFLGDNKWFAGENISFVDFPMYELLDQHKLLEPTCLDNFPKLAGFLKRFEALPAVKQYMESDKFIKAPVNNLMAHF